MKIGHFTKTENGEITGRVQTLYLAAEIKFVSNKDKTNDDMPDFRIIAVDNDAECGAAWHRMSQDNKPYVSAQIDDPSFPKPIYPVLTKGDKEELILYWNRPKNKKGASKPSQQETI